MREERGEKSRKRGACCTERVLVLCLCVHDEFCRVETRGDESEREHCNNERKLSNARCNGDSPAALLNRNS